MRQTSAVLTLVLSAFLFNACAPVEPPSSSPPPETTGVVSTGPLPDGAYRASLSIANPPQSIRAGEQAAIQVKVKNQGNVTWPSTGQGPKYKVDVGNHWLDKSGKLITMDDGRAGLPHDLKPGEEADILLTVKAPKTPGDYILEVDVIHEDVTWFGPRGSQTAKVNVKVQ